eukprot:266732_1
MTQYKTHKRSKDDTCDGKEDNAFGSVSMKELLQSILPHYHVLTFGYIRENTLRLQNKLNIPTSIITYIAVFAFYGPRYQYKSDFDRNGIVNAIATHYGQTQWANPAKQGLIAIKSSGWEDGNIEDVLSRTKVMGDCGSSNTKHSWLSIDFGAKKKIKPSHYTLRHDGWNGGYLRKWHFEGSNDGINWNVLMEHHNDKNLNSPYATHTWAIDGNGYYQMFRIFMTGINSTRQCYLSCSGFEIYGYLTHESSVSDTYVVGFTAMPHLKGDLLNESNL